MVGETLMVLRDIGTHRKLMSRYPWKVLPVTTLASLEALFIKKLAPGLCLQKEFIHILALF